MPTCSPQPTRCQEPLYRDNLIPSESFVHWIWSTLRFETRNLQTRQGHKVQIIDPGLQNQSDGPDFSAARIYLNELYWYGKIEIHVNEQDWYHHNHHLDEAYNGVILHVVIHENASRPIRRQDGTIPPTLSLKPYLKKGLHHFVRKFKQSDHTKELPCSQHPRGILRDDIFAAQLKRAHQTYFYHKVYDLYKFWDHQLPWKKAWKKMTTLSLFDGLGISYNRNSMVRLAKYIFKKDLHLLTLDTLFAKTAEISGLNKPRGEWYPPDKTKTSLDLNWNFKGVRPNNRPEIRIKQGLFLLKQLQATSFDQIMHQDPALLWDSWLKEASETTLTPGQQRANILYCVSLIPCLRVAADLHGDRDRAKDLRRFWNKNRVPVPKKYTRFLENTQINKDIYSRCLGTVYQLRQFCFKKRCKECLIFQKAFFS